MEIKPKTTAAMDVATAAYWTRMFLIRVELKSKTKDSAASIGPLIDSNCFVAIRPRVASESP